jgi:hypothetical protein
VGQERLGPSYFFISLVLGPLNSLLWYVSSSRYIWSLGSSFLFLQEQIPGGSHHRFVFTPKNAANVYVQAASGSLPSTPGPRHLAPGRTPLAALSCPSAEKSLREATSAPGSLPSTPGPRRLAPWVGAKTCQLVSRTPTAVFCLPPGHPSRALWLALLAPRSPGGRAVALAYARPNREHGCPAPLRTEGIVAQLRILHTRACRARCCCCSPCTQPAPSPPPPPRHGNPTPPPPGGSGSSRRGRGMGGQNGPQADADVLRHPRHRATA